tara:strand:+ start:125154 stop:125474 length:321 start_codon:yes stop_codon:yes gene_type:complete
MLQKIRWFFLLVGVTIVLLLLLWNSSAVTVKFPFVAERQLPLSILLFTTSSLSFVFGAIVTGWMLRRRHKAAAKAEAAKKSATGKKSQPAAAEVSPTASTFSKTTG